MRYAVVIEKAEGNYSAYVPDLPGCVATGATVAEVEAEIRDAIVFHVEGLREDGLPVPSPSSQVEYVEIPRVTAHCADAARRRPHRARLVALPSAGVRNPGGRLTDVRQTPRFAIDSLLPRRRVGEGDCWMSSIEPQLSTSSRLGKANRREVGTYEDSASKGRPELPGDVAHRVGSTAASWMRRPKPTSPSSRCRTTPRRCRMRRASSVASGSASD